MIKQESEASTAELRPRFDSTHALMKLFAVTPEGPRELSLPADVSEPTEVFDNLPRGIYEAMRTFDHDRFVGLEEHLDRAARSLDLLEIEAHLDLDAIRLSLHQAVTEAPWPDSRVRFDVLRGPPEALSAREQCLIQVVELRLPPEEAYLEGVRVPLTDRVRRTRPEAKSADWVIERRAAYPPPGEGYDPILVDPKGFLLEGVMSNLFLVTERGLQTAPTRGVLPGITRDTVITLAQDMGLRLTEERISRDRLYTADEVFLTGTAAEVTPVREVDRRVIGAGARGPITGRIQSLFQRVVKGQESQYSDWLTPIPSPLEATA